MNCLVLSHEHRIINGRQAALALVVMKAALEDPQRLLLDFNARSMPEHFDVAVNGAGARSDITALQRKMRMTSLAAIPGRVR